MKKVILLLALLYCSITTFSQVLTAKKADSIAVTAFSKVAYPNATLKASIDSLTSIYRIALAKLNYTVPVLYTVSGPIKLQSNHTYQYLTIDLKNQATVAMSGSGIQNVIIKHCRILNATGFGINIYGGSNILIDSNYFNMVGFPVYLQKCSNQRVTNNQCLNLNDVGNLGSYFAHFIQFDKCNGGGQKMNYNRIENEAGIAQKPHDLYSVYQSNGLPGDSIQIIGNWARGGQRALNAQKDNGACGIGLMDGIGSYQVCRGNILVNTGYAGIQPIGKGIGLKIDHNIIFSSQTPVSLVGLSYQLNGSGYVGYNQINWTTSTGKKLDTWSSVAPPTGWNTNILQAAITPAVLPAQIITFK